MSEYKKVKKNMTYEQIGEIVEMSPQQVHKVEKETINKIISIILEENEYNIFEVVLSMCEKFGVEPSQLYNKLNEQNKQVMYTFINDNYGKEHPEFRYEMLDF